MAAATEEEEVEISRARAKYNLLPPSVLFLSGCGGKNRGREGSTNFTAQGKWSTSPVFKVKVDPTCNWEKGESEVDRDIRSKVGEPPRAN